MLRLSDKQYREFSPVSYVTKDAPPTLIMHGNADRTVPIIQGEIMFKKLQSTRVGSQHIEFESTNHWPTIEQAQRGVSETLRWFVKHLSS